MGSRGDSQTGGAGDGGSPAANRVGRSASREGSACHEKQEAKPGWLRPPSQKPLGTGSCLRHDVRGVECPRSRATEPSQSVPSKPWSRDDVQVHQLGMQTHPHPRARPNPTDGTSRPSPWARGPPPASGAPAAPWSQVSAAHAHSPTHGRAWGSRATWPSRGAQTSRHGSGCRKRHQVPLTFTFPSLFPRGPSSWGRRAESVLQLDFVTKLKIEKLQEAETQKDVPDLVFCSARGLCTLALHS